MRAAIAALALTGLLSATPASAAEWTRVPARDQHEHYYDRAKLVIEGDHVTYWRRVIFRTAQPVSGGLARTAMYRERIDCAQHTHRTLGYLLYGQDGNVLDNVYAPDAAAEPIIPETVGDRFERLMCAMVERERTRQQAAGRAEAAAKPTQERDVDSLTPAQLHEEIVRLEQRLEQLRMRLNTSGSPTALREEPMPPVPPPAPVPPMPQAAAGQPVLPAGTPHP
ncbi:MAG: hypothetical protein KIS79_06740 [Burkholderiales bacterium]|nr:hypothetical protein [Burkholderiales bacterium]